MEHNNSICRITVKDFSIADSYIFPDRVLLYTIACIDSSGAGKPGYVIAGVAADDFKSNSLGHEYWLFAADNLTAGPVCKMGDKSLNNSTLFHTVYIPSSMKNKWKKNDTSYNVDLREDYPEDELKKWDSSILKTFNDIIWPYYDKTKPEAQVLAFEKAEKLSPQRVMQHVGCENIIGEQPVSDAALFAEKMITEGKRMWTTSGWKLENKGKGIYVESKPVKGDFAESGIMVMRSSGYIYADAETVFTLLTSPEGFAILDPVSKPEDHFKPPLETYP